jgi:hypothetical protein
MKFSTKFKFGFIVLFIILNIILRLQVIPHEIGWDSFEMHSMANSLSEFGYAKWFLHPLSIVGLYPASYSSSMHFLLSGISQSTGIEMEKTIFLYNVIIGLLSMFTAYLMAGEIINDDLFKLLAAFGFTTSPAVLEYTTWTITSRALLIVLAPLLIYLMLKCRTSIKYVLLAFLLIIFLFSTHHLFYFLIPAFFSFFILIVYLKFKKYVKFIKISEKLTPLFIVSGFLFMYSIPFFTHRFLEVSRYSPVFLGYIRYTGILIISAIGGLVYLIFKHKKSFGEWFLLLTLIFLTTFIYEQTYMKWFLPIFLMPFASIGLLKVIELSEKRKNAASMVVIFLLLSIIFSGYYQFLHNYPKDPYNERYIEESTYKTGRWMKDNLNGSTISNDILFGARIFAASETAHILTTSTVSDQIYGFITINLSEFKIIPVSNEGFWFNGYDGPDVGEETWAEINLLVKSPYGYNITYVVENSKANGNIIWGHQSLPSKILYKEYDEGYLVYDGGKSRVWKLKLE